MRIYDVNGFKFDALDDVTTETYHLDKISPGYFTGDPRRWYCKNMSQTLPGGKKTNGRGSANVTTFAQEFMRLIIPYEPISRMGIYKRSRIPNPENNCYFVFTEEVKGFKNLPDNEYANFTNGKYKGLGQVILLSMFLQEVELRDGHIGLDQEDRVIRLDCSDSFAYRNFKDVSFEITKDSIKRLPYPKDFFVINWLDFVIDGEANDLNSLIPEEINKSTQFKNELYSCLLQLSALPQSFLIQFTKEFWPTTVLKDTKHSLQYMYCRLLIDRRQLLYDAALEIKSFTRFLETEPALKALTAIFSQMINFAPHGGDCLIKETQSATIRETFFNRLKEMGLGEKVPHVQRYIVCTELLQKIHSLKISKKDILTTKFIAQKELELSESYTNLEKLTNLQITLETTLASVSSNEVKETLAVSKSFKAHKNFFTIGMGAKARAIKRALLETPLEDRGNVITAKTPTEVQIELARHRHIGRRGSVFFKHAEIDEKHAANSYKELRDRFLKN